MNPPFVDRPFPWIHFRLKFAGIPAIIAIPQPQRDIRWQELHDIGVRSVLRLAEESPKYDPTPLALLGEVALEDQYEEEKPTDGETEEALVRRAVQLLRSGLENGGVAVHCVGGRGRTGTVIGGFLQAQGLPAAEVISLLNAAYKSAGRPGWPESSWQREVIGRIQF